MVNRGQIYIHLTNCEVAQALENLDPNKACGPDNIPGRILKETARKIAPSLCRLFNLSPTLGVFPAAWKRANITPIFKQEVPRYLPTTDLSHYCA